MAYTKQEWKDLPDTSTPLTAESLNHMEEGIYQNSYEKITNANGTALKFTDGTLICYEKETRNVAITTQASGVYYYTAGFTFPVAFTEPPTVIPNVAMSDAGIVWTGFGNANSNTTTTTNIRILSLYQRAAADYDFMYIAIGNWK